MFLYISSDKDIIKLALFNEKKIVKFSALEVKSDTLLVALHKILKQKRVPLRKMRGIIRGPIAGATFSSSRGITNFVNMLAFALHVPLAGTKLEIAEKNILSFCELAEKTKPDTFLLPEYSAEPNITIPHA